MYWPDSKAPCSEPDSRRQTRHCPNRWKMNWPIRRLRVLPCSAWDWHRQRRSSKTRARHSAPVVPRCRVCPHKPERLPIPPGSCQWWPAHRRGDLIRQPSQRIFPWPLWHQAGFGRGWDLCKIGWNKPGVRNPEPCRFPSRVSTPRYPGHDRRADQWSRWAFWVWLNFPWFFDGDYYYLTVNLYYGAPKFWPVHNYRDA